MNTARLNRNGQVSIPASIRRALGLKEGDELGFELEGNAVRVSPVVSIPKDQLWFYTREIQKKIQKARKEIDQGKTRSFSDPDDLVRWLKN